MEGKRPLTIGQRRRNESNVVTTETDDNTPTPPPGATLMPLAHFSGAAIADEHIDPYTNLFPPLSYPGSQLYDLVQQNAIPPHLTSIAPTDFPWNTSIPQQSFQQLPQADPSQYHMSTLQLQGHSDMTRGTMGPRGTMVHPPISPEVELEAAEDKRHRNTAASARFRTKKKHKTITLERSVTDLTGRAKDLEREVSDLRRENGWLKEIVMLKGAQYAANNPTHREALQHAARLVTGGQIDFPPATVGSSGKEQSEEESEEGTDLEADVDKNAKGKKAER